MTVEQAVYFKVLLICGYNYELNDYIDNALETSEMPDEIIIDLVFCKNEKRGKNKVCGNAAGSVYLRVPVFASR